MQAILAGTREAFGWVLVLRIGLIESHHGTCCEGTVKVWRRIVSVVWVTSWLLLHTGEVHEFREGNFHGKENSVRMVRFVDVKYASGCCAKALTNRW